MKIITTYIFIALFAASSFAQECDNTSQGFTPITDLGAGYFSGYQGGLYPGGSNTRPGSFNIALIKQAKKIKPLDTAGVFNLASGKIVFLSIGGSNIAMESPVLADSMAAYPYVNPKLVYVNGGAGGKTIDKLIDPMTTYWNYVKNQLELAGLTENQVQVIWFKEADATPDSLGFPGAPNDLRNDYKLVMQILKEQYPNLKICYQSGRAYAGYIDMDDPPSAGLRAPHDYYNGWACKWLIEDQINGDTNITYAGLSAKSPMIAWGPYLWADGLTPRSDGLIWECTDFKPDGLHTFTTGREKIAHLWMDFLRTDASAAPWFKAPLVMVSEPALANTYEIAKRSDVSVYPNPTEGASTISFTLDRQSQVVVTLYDMQGRVVRSLIDSQFQSGENEMSLLTTGIAKGLYQVRLSGEAINEVRQVVVK